MKLKYVFLIIISIIFLLFSSCNEQKVLKAENLVISEGFKNPIGFYNPQPTFSWELSVSNAIKSQSAYQIVVATSQDLLPDNADLWDSKKQQSNQSTFIKYKGKELNSRQKVYWQVRYWDQDANDSNWSNISSFELGLLNNSDWKATV